DADNLVCHPDVRASRASLEPPEVWPMTDAAIAPLLVSTPRSQAVTTEQPLVRYVLIGLAVTFLVVFLFLPLASVFVEALSAGLGAYFASITEPDAVSAIKLTLLIA